MYVTSIEKLTSAPQHQYEILQNMKVAVQVWPEESDKLPEEVDLIIDGIVGYSLAGNPHGKAQAMIEWANRQKAPTLSLDTPSGIDLTESKSYEPTVTAEVTLTLALPK